MAKKKEKGLKEQLNQLTMLIQMLLMEFIIVFVILALYVPEFSISLVILMGITLLVLSYNNYAIYKRKYFTLIYLIFGIASLASVILKSIYG